jgi:hypothetical protein
MKLATAKKKAYAGNIRVGYLRQLLDGADTSKPCKINRSLTRAQAIDILRGALEGMDDDATPDTTHINWRNREALNAFGKSAQHIMVECG